MSHQPVHRLASIGRACTNGLLTAPPFRLRRALALALLAFLLPAGALPGSPAPAVVRDSSTLQVIRVGYTTFDSPGAVLTRGTSLESFTEYLKMVSALSSPEDGS